MFVHILGVPVRLNCRMTEEGQIVAFSVDWPVLEVQADDAITAMQKLAAAIELDMGKALFERQKALLAQGVDFATLPHERCL